MRYVISVGLFLLLGGCTTSTTLNSMYIKQNYLQVIQQTNQYEDLEDYGMWKICQSLAHVELYDDFYLCQSQLKVKIDQDDGLIAEQFTPSMKIAMFESMEAEVELGLGRHESAVALSEKVIERMEDEPYDTNLIDDTGLIAYEATTVLLRARAALGDKQDMLNAIEKAKHLALYRQIGEDGKLPQVLQYRIIQDFKLSPILAEAYYSAGDYEQALAYSTEVIDALENVGLLQSVLFSSITMAETALSGARTAEGKVQTFSDTMFSNKLLPRIIKASSEYELGKFESAKLGFDEVLSTQLITGLPKLYYPVLHDRGRVAEALGEDKVAAQFYRSSIEVIETNRRSIQDDAAKISYVGNKQQVYQSLVSVLLRQGKVGEAFQVAENAKARALIDLLASKDDSLVLPPNAATNVAAKSLYDIELVASTGDLLQRSGSRSVNLQKYQAAAQSLKDSAPEYASLVTSEPTDLHEIQRLLTPKELLLEYYEANGSLIIFSISTSEIRAYSVDASQLSFLVGEFRRSISDVKSNKHQEIGAELYNLLLKPAAAEMMASTGITIVPHGALHYLPFAALYSGKQYLIDEKPTRMLPSASVLQFLGKRHQDDASLLVLGNPDRDNSDMSLPGAEREALAIVQQNQQRGYSINAALAAPPATVLLLREQATETAIKQTAAKFQYIHFASHGVFDNESPLNSRLLLAKDAENDGDLTVRELYSLKLNAELVTLSACQTALGEVASGDDVVGFSRAFLYAGAESIISSLWEVDDQATNKLMQSFYKNLQTMSKRSALTEAILLTKQTYKHPYYWAAFQLTGSI